MVSSEHIINFKTVMGQFELQVLIAKEFHYGHSPEGTQNWSFGLEKSNMPTYSRIHKSLLHVISYNRYCALIMQILWVTKSKKILTSFVMYSKWRFQTEDRKRKDCLSTRYFALSRKGNTPHFCTAVNRDSTPLYILCDTIASSYAQQV